MLANVYNHSLN